MDVKTINGELSIMLQSAEEIKNFYLTSPYFIPSVEYTADIKGFSTLLIEKDFLCSLVLAYFTENKADVLIFKGGTLLAKVYSNFYRLSEDLDFSISTAIDATRKVRSDNVKSTKKIIHAIPEKLPIFTVVKPLEGSNASRQYNAELSYISKLSGTIGRIFIEIGLREEILLPTTIAHANTLLADVLTQNSHVKPILVRCLSLKEAYAEKIRAALTRKKAAIRDFYDLHHAIKNKVIDIHDIELLEILKKKLSIPNTRQIELDENKYILLNSKMDGELYSTLSNKGESDFNLEKIFLELNHYIKKYDLTAFYQGK